MSSTTTNRALTGPVFSTFFYYVVPSMMGLMALTTANLVDGIFVGNIVGADALAAITLLLPYITLLIAISLMLAIGGAVSAGKYIGEGNVKAASGVFSKTLITAAVANACFAVISVILEPLLYAVLNVPIHIQPLITEYFDVIRWVFILQLTTMVLYYFVRADGHPILGTWALVTGALTNILLDALFIFYLDMGIAGAAYATAIAQLLQFAVLSRYFVSQRRTLQFSLVQQDWREMLSTAYNGISEFINEISVGLLFLLLNWLLIAKLGTDGVAAFSVVNYVIFLSVMMHYGVADALHLLVSQNFGAKNSQRIEQFLCVSISSVLSLGVLLVCLLVFAQQTLIDGFLNQDAQNVADLAAQITLLLWPLFLVNGINILSSCYLTAVHKPGASAVIASARSFVMPAVVLISLYVGFYHLGIIQPAPSSWLFLIGLPIAEWVTFVLALFYLAKYSPKKIME